MTLARVRKALLAGLGATASALAAAIVQKGGLPGWPEVGVAIGAGVTAGWAVWQVKNAPPAAPAGVTGPYVGNH